MMALEGWVLFADDTFGLSEALGLRNEGHSIGVTKS